MPNRLVGLQGVALGHRSIDQIGRVAQPVSPRNYEVWLAYLTDSVPALRAAIDAMIAQGAAFDEGAMASLYQSHFSRATPSHNVFDTGSRIAHEVTDALDALKFVSANTDRYGETLDAAVTTLLSVPADTTSLRQLVSHLAKATTQIAETHQTLAGKLSESSAEMEQLRVSLAEARKQSLTDSLTGVANRKRFDETLRMRHEEALHDETSLVVAICDIDHFKTFNDTWGHQTGDGVIRLVAATMARLALADQLVARLGGEEFGIIMPRRSLQDAAEQADGIRRAIYATRLRHKESAEVMGHISVSFGVARLGPGETGAQLVARADECLYLSKRHGRNRVSIETDLDASP
jgi:diguanylate cyclase